MGWGNTACVLRNALLPDDNNNVPYVDLVAWRAGLPIVHPLPVWLPNTGSILEHLTSCEIQNTFRNDGYGANATIGVNFFLPCCRPTPRYGIQLAYPVPRENILLALQSCYFLSHPGLVTLSACMFALFIVSVHFLFCRVRITASRCPNPHSLSVPTIFSVWSILLDCHVEDCLQLSNL